MKKTLSTKKARSMGFFSIKTSEMEKKKRESQIDKDILNVRNEADDFSNSELEVLNLIAQIIVEYVLNEEK